MNIKKYGFIMTAALMTALAPAAVTAAEDVTVTYHYNMDGMEDTAVTQEADSRLATETPEMEGYQLIGWYTDEELTQN